MTYTVSSGILNSTIPYHTILYTRAVVQYWLFNECSLLCPNSSYTICCGFAVQHVVDYRGFVVQLVVQQIRNKSYKWSLGVILL